MSAIKPRMTAQTGHECPIRGLKSIRHLSFNILHHVIANMEEPMPLRMNIGKRATMGPLQSDLVLRLWQAGLF